MRLHWNKFGTAHDEVAGGKGKSLPFLSDKQYKGVY